MQNDRSKKEMVPSTLTFWEKKYRIESYRFHRSPGSICSRCVWPSRSCPTSWRCTCPPGGRGCTCSIFLQLFFCNFMIFLPYLWLHRKNKCFLFFCQMSVALYFQELIDHTYPVCNVRSVQYNKCQEMVLSWLPWSRIHEHKISLRRSGHNLESSQSWGFHIQWLYSITN